MKLYFGVFLEKTPNHFGLGKATVTKFLYKETALAWRKRRCEYGTERAVFETEKEVINVEQTARLFLQFLKTEQPPEFYQTRAQRFFQFYCDNLSFAHYCKTQLLRESEPEAMERILQDYFEQVPTDRFIEI